MGNGAEQTTRQVRETVRRRVAESVEGLLEAEEARHLGPGKMLRTRLAVRLAEANPDPPTSESLEAACVATEIVHTASLLHDDLIDGARRRRGRPAVWRTRTPLSAVLLGDMLLCRAFDVVAATGDHRMVRAFAGKVREVCATEAEQELRQRGEKPSLERYLRLCRGLTGPLFAFPAWAAGGAEPGACVALEEAGYRIGAAYQLADDLLDVVGDEHAVGKTLGTDALRQKHTLANAGAEGRGAARERIADLCMQALDGLDSFAWAAAGLAAFLRRDLQPVLERHLDGVNVLPPALRLEAD